jgi:hypothetical protein
MMEKSELETIDQRYIQFYGDEILAARVADGTVYVPVRPICDLIGVNWAAQYQRIQRDPILSEVVSGVVVTPTPRDNKFANPQEMICLPLDFLNGWLFGMNANRVKSDIREKLLTYQRECYRVLAEAFLRDQITHRPDSAIDDLLNSDSPTAQAYKMAKAIMQMARQQLVLESRVESAESGIATNRSEIELIDTRVQLLEARGGDPSRQIDEAQASRISQAVKAIALELGKRSGRNEFAGVYGELYRRFDITGYKLLPAIKFQEAIHFLSDWYQSLTDIETPF